MVNMVAHEAVQGAAGFCQYCLLSKLACLEVLAGMYSFADIRLERAQSGAGRVWDQASQGPVMNWDLCW